MSFLHPVSKKVEFDYFKTASWLSNEVSDLEFLAPGEWNDPDVWVITEAILVVGMAVVEPDYDDRYGKPYAFVHRIGVMDDRQNEGFGTSLLRKIHEEYGPLELEVRAGKPANFFYERAGLDLVEEKAAGFEDGEGILNVWRWG